MTDPATAPRRDPLPLVFGVVVSTILAGTLTLAGLKAGITPGVSPLVILFAWGAFTRRIASGGGTVFLNVAQVAGSAGMAICAGVIFTAPLLQILHADQASFTIDGGAPQPALQAYKTLQTQVAAADPGAPEREALLEQLGAAREVVLAAAPPVDVATLVLLCLAGALIGFGFVGLATRKFLTDPSLPAPEAQACRTIVEAAVARPEERPRLLPSLVLGTGLSFLAPLLVHLGFARDHVVLFSRSNSDESRVFNVDLPFTPIYIGIGGLLTLATALLVFGGSLVHVVSGLALAGIEPGSEAAELFPGTSARWIGGAAMAVAVAWSLVRFAGLGKRDVSEAAATDDDERLLELTPGTRRTLVACIGLGTALLVGWLLATDGMTPFSFAMAAALLACATVMVTLGALLSLQVGSSASPVSGTVFVTTLVLCLVALAVGRRELDDVALLTPLLVGACVAVCTANDSSQDYKTLQLCGVPVRIGFLGQMLGLLGGCVAVPLVLYVAHGAYVLGSNDLPAPQGTLFATVVDALLLQGDLPWYPIAIGLVLGLVAVGIEIWGHGRGLLLPSMALAVGIYLPPYLGIGILIGALFRRVAERGLEKPRPEAVLAAAGLITGAALLDLLLGGAIIGIEGFTTESLNVTLGPDGLFTRLFGEGFDASTALNAGGLLGIVALGLVLYFNARRRGA